MAVRSLGQLTLDLVAKIGGFTRGMTEAERVADQKSRDIARKNRQRAKEVETAWKNAAGLIAGAFAGISIANVFQTFIRESIEAQNEQAQLAAVLKSTGQAAGFTADQLNKMSAELAGRSVFSEGDITKAQTRLLSYTGIVGEQFPAAMQAVIDMAARMGMSVEQSAETIGRALDIPSQGLTALQRQGFRFTEEQKKAVEQLEKTGRVAEAQAIVLDALKLSYGGAAEAARNTFGGAVTALQEQLRTLLTGSDGSLNDMTVAVNDLTKTLSSPEIVQAFNTLGTLIANTIGLLVKGAAAFLEFGKAIGTGLAIRINGPDDALSIVQEKIRVINAEITSLEGLLNRPKTGLPISKQELDEINNRLSTARRELEQLRKAEAGVSSGFGTPAGTTQPTRSGVTAPSQSEIAALAAAAKLREERERGAKEAVRQAQSYLENLKKQLQATEELSVAETVLRDIQAGRVKLAGGVTQQQLLDIAKQIDLAKEMEEIEKEFKKLEEESIERKKKLQDAGKAVYDATRTPAERLNIELARLNDLLQKGAIDWDTYSRAVFEAQDGFDEAMKKGKEATSELDKFSKQAAENIQDYFGQSLYDLMSGNFNNIGDAFVQMINRMVAEAAAAQLAKHLFGDLVEGGSGSGWFGDAFKALGGILGFSGRAAGGAVLPGQVYRVNENGPEMLEMDGRSYLMMGNRSGNVVPSGGGMRSIVINQNFPQNTTRATTLQAASDARRVLEQAQRNM